jgi:hypothetical protein
MARAQAATLSAATDDASRRHDSARGVRRRNNIYEKNRVGAILTR